MYSGENFVRSVLWHFRCFFRSCWGQSCTIVVCPRSFLCAWLPEIALLRACRADDFGWFGHGVHFSRFFPAFFCFFRGGSNMAGKIPTMFAVSCYFCPTFPSLFFSSFLLHFPSCFPFFLQCFLFSPQRFLVKATRLHVTPLSAMCFVRHLPHT